MYVEAVGLHMPKNIKWKVVNHTNLANTNSNEAALNNELFTFVSIMFGSGKQGKLKLR